MKAFSSVHRVVYPISSGWAGRTIRGGRVLLLTTTGRRTKRARTWPLCFLETGDDYVVVASAAGAERHPGWYLNLRANPQVRVQVGRRSRTMIARTAEGLDRARLWDRLVRQYPMLDRYQEQVSRTVPVIVLQPARAASRM